MATVDRKPPTTSPISTYRLSGPSKRYTSRKSNNFEADRNMEDIQEGQIKDGFGFDIDLDLEDSPSPQKESKPQLKEPTASTIQTKKVGEIASMFLQTRKALQIDCNVLEPYSDSKAPTHNGVEISRRTIVRAERVKSMLSVKYVYINKLYEIGQNETSHPEVEGVYNPLQIIRNRKLRAKHKEFPKPLSIKMLSLASNVFSKNNSHKKPWKMIWAVELPEYMGDLTWNRHHWNELRNSKGKLWYPTDKESETSSSSGETRQRLHDKLFGDEKSIAEADSKRSSRRRLSSSASNSTDSEGQFFKITSTRSPVKSNLKEKVKKHTKRLYNASSSSSNTGDEREDENSNGSKSLIAGPGLREPRETIKEQLFKRLSVSPERNIDSLESSVEPKTPVAPQPKAASPTHLEVIDVPIKPVDSRSTSNADVDEEEIHRDNEKAPDAYYGNEDDMESVIEISNGSDEVVHDQVVVAPGCDLDLNARELQEIFKNINYFDQVVNLRMNYVINVYPQLTKTIDDTLKNIIQTQLHDIFQLTMNISDDQLPIYEQMYTGFLNEIRAIVHLINDDYSIKIDNLLSTSDRSIGEISTSLSLELRKINERIDKLNTSLFSNNVVTETFKDTEISLRIKNGNNNRVLYLCLENVIVVLLRFIWVIVNIYKLFVNILWMIWRVIKFVIF